MKKYIAKFNNRFSVTPKGNPVFRKLDKKANIDYILCSKYQRKLDSGSAFSYRGKYFQLISGGKPATTIPRSSIKVIVSKRIGIKASYSGKVYNVVRLETRPKVSVDIKIDKKLVSRKPAAVHPWKSVNLNGFKYDPRDEEISRGLFNWTIAWEPDSY
jgi:hypothetical protein